MNEFLKLLTESPDNEALVKMLTQGMQGSVKSNDIGGNLLKTGLSTAGTAAFGPIGGVAGTVLGQLLVPNKQEPQPINPRVQRNLNPYGMATGGMVQNGQGLVPVEVEGDEMFELPNGQVGEFQGPDHEQGGIPTQLPPGTNVYSKRMTGADGRSMADRKESRERRLRKILAQLDKRPTDAPTINSVSREVNRIQAEEEQDMQIMQMYQLRDMLAQARQGQMQGQMSPEMMQQQQMQQGQMSPEMMQGQMPQEMMQGEMPMMRGGGKVDPRLGTGRDMANINKVAPEVAPNQIDLIHQYHKGKGDIYQILDKAGGKRTFYRDGEELFTHPVLVGANEGDDPTMTVLNEGGVDWEAGNKMTGAGVFEVSEAQKRNSNYQNAPFYVYKNVATGKNIRSSDHAVLGSRRARLQDDDFTNNRMTNGCVNANCDDLKEVYNAGYGVGNRRYVLPEDGYNYFDMEDGEIVMKTRYTGGDLPEVTVTAERPSVIGMSPQLVEMPRESTAVSMPMMQAGGVIGDYAGDDPLFPFFGRYKRFKNSLPPNLRDGDETYDMKYLWKHGGKPKSFEESINRENPMFSLGEDGDYHGGSVEPNTGRFVKRFDHESIQKELDWYNSEEGKDFRSKYDLDKSGEFYRYVPKQTMQAGGVIRNGNTMNGFTDLAMLLGGYNKMQDGGTVNDPPKSKYYQKTMNEILGNEVGNEAWKKLPFAEKTRRWQAFKKGFGRDDDATLHAFRVRIDKWDDSNYTNLADRANENKTDPADEQPPGMYYKNLRGNVVDWGVLNREQRKQLYSDIVKGKGIGTREWQDVPILKRMHIVDDFLSRVDPRLAQEKGYGDDMLYLKDLIDNYDKKELNKIINNYRDYIIDEQNWKFHNSGLQQPYYNQEFEEFKSNYPEIYEDPDYIERGKLQAKETANTLRELGQFFNPANIPPAEEKPVPALEDRPRYQMAQGGTTGFTDLAMLLGGYNKMAAGGTTSMMSDDYINQFANYQLPVMAAGGEVQGEPSLREALRKILQYETNHGASDGSGLSNFGNKEVEKDFKNEEEALDWIMENIVPKIPEDLSTLEKLAFADHLYNTGTDPRVWAYQAYLQSIDSDKLKDGEWKDRMKYKEAMDKGKYEGSKLEKQIDKFYEEVMTLPAEERMKLLNRGRDFYYRNIVPEGEKAVTYNPFGAKSDAYQNTWFQRIINTSNLEPYSYEVYVPYSQDTAEVFKVENLDKPVETTYNPPAAPVGGQTAPAAAQATSTQSNYNKTIEENQNNQARAREFLQTIDINSPTLTEEDKTNITNALETLGYDMTPSPELTTTQVDQFGRQETAIDPFETLVKPAYNEWANQQPSLFQDLLGLNQSFLEGRMSPGYESPYITDTRSTQVSDEQYQRPTDEEIKAAQFTEQDKVLAGLNLNPTTEEEIKKLQKALQAAGYDLGPKGVDGKLGKYTNAAIDSWKTDYAKKEAIQKDLYNYQRSTGLGAATDTQISRLAATDTDAGLLNRGALGEDFSVAAKSQFGDQMIQAGKTTPTTPEEKTEPTWKIDPLTRAGYITSGAGPLITTILNRLGDEPTPNFYANFGRDAERALDAAERGIAGSRDRAYEENRLAQNLRGRQARNAARSSNVMQAMQQAALTSGMKANEQITGQYQNALRALLANRAQFEQGQDQAVMKGREAAYTADLQNRDQFSTNLASNLANAGSMMQTLGRQKEVFDVYNQIGKSGGDATKNTLLDQVMSLYSIGGENKKDTTK